jgi:mono/diheme cytochrome c family protein
VAAPAPRTAQRGEPAATTPVAAGRKIYEHEKCATCHQIAHQGNIRFPLDGVGSRLTADQIRRWITDTAQMEAALPTLPAVRMSATRYKLKPADLDALVAYLSSLKRSAY